MKTQAKSKRRKSKSKSTGSRTREALGLIVLVFGVFLGLALFSYTSPDWPAGSAEDSIANWGGKAGAFFAFVLIHATFGRLFIWLVPLLIVLWGIRLFRPQWRVIKLYGTVKLVALGVAASTVYAYFARIGWASFPTDAVLENTGWVGMSLEKLLFEFVGVTGSGIVLTLAVLLWLIWALKLQPSEVVSGVGKVVAAIAVVVWIVVSWVGRTVGSLFRRRKPFVKVPRESKTRKIKPEKAPEPELEKVPTEKPERKTPVISISRPKTPEPKIPGAIAEDLTQTGVYELPTIDMLDPPPEDAPQVEKKVLENNAALLEEKLADFGVTANVVEIHPGPVIARYDLEPAPGIKVSRITSLEDDLSLALRAKAIRIIAPVPGKGAVGVEVPNPQRAMVLFRSLLEAPKFRSHPSPLLFAVGKTTDGGIRLEDLANMPHLLIAGTTGSGKSVFINSLIVSILFRATPDQVQFILIDPKKLELSGYSELRNHHLVTRLDLGEDVVTTAEGAVEILKSVELEMSRRYDLLAEAGARNVGEYNDKVKDKKGEDAPKPLPFLIVVIDELADLMLLAAKAVEEPIARLAQMSRAVGIHLVVATQRPSVDVITGVIKANFPCRIAFQVASKTDSRTILDMNGAEALLGKGDMLFIPPGQSKPVRLHAALISRDEINRVIIHIRKQPVPQIRVNLPSPVIAGAPLETGDNLPDIDPLFDEAARIVVRTQQGSVSILQRRLKVGYARAARLIDQLERAGIVGPFDGSKAREVLVEEDYFETRDRLE